ncbi:MAG: hypothetical protein AAGE85_04420 [Pseudomonadota bacterium]
MPIRTVLLAIAVFLASPAALSCTCDGGSIDENYAESVAAFRIRVTATELRPTSELDFSRLAGEDDIGDDELAEFLEDIAEYVRVSFEVIEVFKGESNVPPYLHEMTFSPGNCGLGLMTSVEYVIFLSGEPIEFASFCSGSFGFINAEGADVKPNLERLRELAKR